MYNKVVLVGNLTRDVEIRYSQSGSAIGNVGIATSRKWKSQTGEQKDEVMFIDLTFFGRTAEIANQYLRKGSKVLVDGRLQLQQWTAQDGSKRSKHAITVENLQMLDSKADSMNPNHNNGYDQQASQNNYGTGNTQNTNNYPPQENNAYGQPQAPQQPAYAQPQKPAPQPSVPEIDIDDDEIPF
ncbi:MAG: Single-stranded DNA-binding protein [uncultured Sulfurovum sp.]|uniref:Single-stranded DNA-binding protein n=1 Tax=uncultured Sulfurovum sp. TaxID=269237 RepID=A0A6S6TCW9_9BACT|nr:MAG: Single-stranded DNA-binding protein [uncultured Sulfurovum sp.]